MNDPQVWTLIGVFTTMMLGGMTLMTSQFSRVIRAEIGGVTARLDTMDARLTRLEDKVDDLDRELTTLAARFWRSQ